MTTHLSSLEISGLLIGAPSPAAERHAKGCGACGVELRGMCESLARFRGAVRYWTEEPAGIRLRERTLFASSLEAFHDHTGDRARASLASMLAHAAAVALLLLFGSQQTMRRFTQRDNVLILPDLSEYLNAAKKHSGGGGGGGAQQPHEASKGQLPKPAPRQFSPPRVDPVEARLPMPPSIVAPEDLPNIAASNFGDVQSKLGIPSNGIGLAGGIGSGNGGGVGVGQGPGTGPGSGGGFGGGAYRIGGGVSAPGVLFKVEPEYSEEARKAKWQGTVVLSVVVDDQGRPRDVKVLRSLGLGLDQKAMDAVSQWKFKPGTKDGTPVPVIATIEVNFRLL